MSRPEDFESMLKYLKMLDPVNSKIIEALGKYNPRNLLSLAKEIHVPPTTVAFRVKRLTKKGFLTVRAKLKSSKLGLMKAVLVADSNHVFAETLSKVIENVGYWTYMAHCYGKFNGFYAVFSFPAEYKSFLEDYFKKAKELGAITDYVLLWTTNIFEVSRNFDWFDLKRKAWNFHWDKWVREVLTSSDKLPERLKDPDSYEIEADLTDLLILKELEKDGLKDFTKLAKVANITPQAVRHRFHQHVLKRELIAEYEVAIFPYPLQASDLCTFVFDFADEAAMAKFVNSLMNKPFALNFGKVIGQNSLVVHVYVPKTEFSRFVSSLNQLAVEDVIQDFYYVSIDWPSFKRQTVSYEHFIDGKWAYDQAEKIEKLTKMVPIRLKPHVSST